MQTIRVEQVFTGGAVFENGNVTMTGNDVDLSGVTKVTLPANVKVTSNILALTDDYTVLAADSGKIYTMGTDAKTITLPAATVGMNYTFVNIGADGNNTLDVQPDGTETIDGTIANAAADSVASGGAGKYLRNTKASANKGDYVQITCLVAGDWYITGGVGIWASEA